MCIYIYIIYIYTHIYRSCLLMCAFANGSSSNYKMYLYVLSIQVLSHWSVKDSCCVFLKTWVVQLCVQLWLSTALWKISCCVCSYIIR